MIDPNEWPHTRGQPGGASENPGSGVSISTSLPEAADNRRALRTLLSRIDFGEPMRQRAVQEAISNALAATWRRRADTFEQARPRPDDYQGQASAQELAEADRRCTDIALACRSHAAALEAGWFE